MWRARPLSDTAPPKAVPLTHGEARGSVTWTNAVDDEENERRPPEKAAAADDFCEPSKTVKVPPSSKLPRPPPKNGGTKIPVDRDAAAQRARVEAECRANGGVVYTNDDGPVYEPPAETRPDAYATFLGSEAYAPGAEALLRLRDPRAALLECRAALLLDPAHEKCRARVLRADAMIARGDDVSE